ncbi:VOC family protein [Streptomyces sp. AC536]|uniref:VOC family protein n=1 Tax=Streptomyces buecherae TaxID=2763006 RepID=UPI00164DA45D|nr:VOC family protein [Streptomyces buecherae]MBC3985329.1 VOC family protein [Streptomyces buecherae]QNJ41403.1 VOC family protein [Streptomyces buecherae]
MTTFATGTPCWADAMFTDFEGARTFYGDVLGWTFGESSTEFGNYTQAYAGGKAVAAIVPPMPGAEERSAWCLYFASDDAAATAEAIRAAGGEVVMGPMRVSEFGTMVIARDPSGVAFGVWEAGQHKGFEKVAEPGAYCWAEVYTRQPRQSDAFFTAVFPYRAQQMDDEQMDFRVFSLADGPVLGRMAMGEDFPAEVPSHLQVYFAVDDCDAAVARATAGGGQAHFGPMDTPYGRFASLTDPQGAGFAVIDVTRTAGETPRMTDVT